MRAIITANCFRFIIEIPPSLKSNRLYNYVDIILIFCIKCNFFIFFIKNYIKISNFTCILCKIVYNIFHVFINSNHFIKSGGIIMKQTQLSMETMELDHVDIVTSHICNNQCKNCIDKFLGTSNKIISLETIQRFLKVIRKHTDKPLEVLLLGGEPTILPIKQLIDIADLVHHEGFLVMMSTNGKLKKKIIQLIPYYDSIQITVSSDAEIDFWREWSDKINIKLSGDEFLTLEKLNHFVEYTKGFFRRSISMYFTPDFTELCTDQEVWDLLDTLEWKRNGSYLYAFYKGVRIKKCIHGETNIVDEPSVPKVYPNGNYNKTWCNEELDDYLDGTW